MDYEKNYSLLCKKGVSNVLEGVASKNISGGKHPDPYVSTPCLLNRTIVANFLTY